MMDTLLRPEEIDQIIEGKHPSPHSILGNHRLGNGGSASIVIRAFLPGAERASVVAEGMDLPRIPMEKIHEAGFFETVMEERSDFFPYKLEFQTNHELCLKDDPYRYLPTIGDFNLGNLRGEAYHQAYRELGAHRRKCGEIEGVSFALWAPNAQQVSLIADFNNWDHRAHPMRNLGASGIWEIFIPEISEGTIYKYDVRGCFGQRVQKTDPFAFAMEMRPKTASVVWNIDTYEWHDHKWLADRSHRVLFEEPISIYEVHLGSWMRVTEEGNRWLTYRELAVKLVEHVRQMGFTHIELMPIAEHPFDASWGYQVSGYFAPTSRFGKPDDFMYFVDYCHQNGIGVIIDWVPSHFPKDDFSLAKFDGTSLYEHADERQGEHKEWGTLVFNYGREEVRSFLMSNALFWLEKYHVDGFRVDAVASMLYLDYSREEGEWVPNRYGGRENLEAIDFLKELNVVTHAHYPGTMVIAEESTAWTGVSRPTYLGGLGFDFKWNMGWMHDMLDYFSSDPIYRKYKHDLLTFAMLYAFHENFILSLSHDEVVHGKRSLLNKMPGDEWQRFANLRTLYGYMFAQPGKKHLFMGGEFGQWNEWNHVESLDWSLLEKDGPHRKLQQYVKDVHRVYREESALWQIDHDSSGFEWIDFHDWEASIVAFLRYGKDAHNHLVCVFNFTPVPRYGYRVGVPHDTYYREILNSDSSYYGGSNLGNRGGIKAEPVPFSVFSHSISLSLPPLGALYLKPVIG
jgi:1,4-alpha-glucan branching enzyme